MKSFKQKNGMIWLSLILMLITISVTVGCGSDYSRSPTEPVGGGSPLMRLIIENQTKQVLTIYYENYEVGTVEQSGRIVTETSMNMGWYPIEAKNAQGEIVFSETYTFKPKDKYHLQKIEERVYKAVIPPLQSN